MMSLVDYGSSSEDDNNDDVSEDSKQKEANQRKPSQTPKQEPSSSINPNNQKSGSSSFKSPSNSINDDSIKLPDASLLLNSPSISSSISVESRKRNSNQMASSSYANLSTRSKLQKGKLLHAKNVPDTGGGLFVPPQVSGKSNVVTEDIDKLFLKKKNAKDEP